MWEIGTVFFRVDAIIFMAREFKWGIIGPGSIAKEFTEDLINIKQDHHFVKALVGHRKESVEKFLQENKVDNVYYSVKELIDSRSVDCVYVATPHTHHYEACMELLEAGIPVLCEKPMAINAKQVLEIINKSKETNTFFMEGMWIRCLPSIKTVMDIIKSGEIGEVFHMNAKLTYKAPFDPENRYFNPKLGGGSLLDLGVYPIYLSHFILGNPTEIKATSKIINGTDGSTAAVLSCGSGAYSVIESSFITRAVNNDAIIYGDKGSICISEAWNEKPDLITVQIYNGEKREIKPEWAGKGIYFEAEEMTKCMLENRIESELLPHKCSLEVAQVMDEIRNQSNIKYPNE